MDPRDAVTLELQYKLKSETSILKFKTYCEDFNFDF